MGSLLRRDAKVCEVAVAVVSHPQADGTSIERSELADLERRRFDGASVYLDGCAFHDDSERHPLGRCHRWIDRVLEFFRELFSEPRPVVVRERHVLHGVVVPRRFGCPEVEWAQIDGLVRVVILPVERDPKEALLQCTSRPRTSTWIVPSAKSLPSIQTTPGPAFSATCTPPGFPCRGVTSRFTALSFPPASRSARSICGETLGCHRSAAVGKSNARAHRNTAVVHIVNRRISDLLKGYEPVISAPDRTASH